MRKKHWVGGRDFDEGRDHTEKDFVGKTTATVWTC